MLNTLHGKEFSELGHESIGYSDILALRSSQTQYIKTSPVRMSSDQLSSVTQSCLTLCDPMNRSTPGLPVHH